MEAHLTSIRKITLIASLFYTNGWRYCVGPKIISSGDGAFATKEEAATALQREIEHILAALAPQWEITVKRKEW